MSEPMPAHMIQYALVGHRGVFVGHTEVLSDEEVRARVPFGACATDRVERYDRCPECESWTKARGRLRRNMVDCPAVRAAMGAEVPAS